MSGGKILIIDEDSQTRRILRTALSAHEYEVVDARGNEEGLEKMRQELPDLVLLDLNTPISRGLETCLALRSGSEIQIIAMSASKAEEDKVKALDAGADDYITKPLSIGELLARIRARMRRIPKSAEAGRQFLASNDVEIDFGARHVKAGGKPRHLTPKEFHLLRCLVAHAGRPVSHRTLLHTVWGPDYGERLQYLRVFINQLRKKVEPDPSNPRHILTEPWLGYRFVLRSEA